jgi:hypothetical protein
MESGMIRYVPPRRAELDQGEKGNVFDDKRTGRQRADKYTGKDAYRMQFEKEIRDAIEEGYDERPFEGTNIKPTPKQQIRRMAREKSGKKT